MSWFTYYSSVNSTEPLHPPVRRYIDRFTPKDVIEEGQWMSIDVVDLDIDKIINTNLELVNNDFSYKVVYHDENVDGDYVIVDSVIDNERLYFKSAEQHLANETIRNRYHVYYMDNNLKNIHYDEFYQKHIILNSFITTDYIINKYEVLNTSTGYYSFSYLNTSSDWSNGYSNKVGATATLLFSGPTLLLYGNTGPDYGAIEVTTYPIVNDYFTEVEDKIIDVIDLYSTSENLDTLIYSLDSLSYRDYIINIKSIASQNIKSTSSKFYISKAKFDLGIYLKLSKEELYDEASFNFLKVSNSKIFTLQNLKPGKKYIVTARAKNSDINVNSYFLNTKMFTVPQDATIPTTPENLFIDSSFLNVTYTFDPVTDTDLVAYEYELYEDSQIEIIEEEYVIKDGYDKVDDWSQLGLDIDGENSGDLSGYSVALSSDGLRLAIGAPRNDGNGSNSGHVRVFDWDGSAWIQVGSDIDGEAPGDRFGWSVSLSSDGSRLAVGAPFNGDNGDSSGSVRVYEWSGSTWFRIGPDINGRGVGDRFGTSVALSSNGNTLAIGAPYSNVDGVDSGSVRVFDWNSEPLVETWIQVGSDIIGEADNDLFGTSVALSSNGNRLAVGAPRNDDSGIDSGSVRVYGRSGSTWFRVGSDINGKGIGDRFGEAVAFSSDGSRLAVGAPYSDGNGLDSGSVRVFDWNSEALVETWIQVGSDIIGEASYDNFGFSVALSSDGNRLVVGAPFSDTNGTNSGHVRVFDLYDSNWIQIGVNISGEEVTDYFGFSVAISDNGVNLAIGAPYNDGNGVDSGHVRVYSWPGSLSGWVQVGSALFADPASEYFGKSLALSSDGKRLAVSAPLQDGGPNNSVFYTGTVRVFDWDGSTWVQAGSEIDGEDGNDYFGWSVALSSDGNRLAVGAPFNDGGGINSGSVRVFDWSGSVWFQVGSDINGEDGSDYFGWSVALSSDGNRLAVGASFNNGGGLNSGSVRVFDWNSEPLVETWIQVGSDIDGEAEFDNFGISVALSSDGNRLAIGADRVGNNKGSATVFDWDGSVWNQVGSTLFGTEDNEQFGFSVDLSSDGNRLAVGSFSDIGGLNSGSVRVFDWDGSDWVQVGSDIRGENSGDYLGYSVALSSDGNRLVAGAPYGDNVNSPYSGYAEVYEWSGSLWSLVGQRFEGSEYNLYFGWSVAISDDGSRIAVSDPEGAPQGSSDDGRVQVFDWYGVRPYLSGFSSSNVFTISIDKSTTVVKEASYYGRVRSIDTSGNVSSWSNVVKSGNNFLLDDKYIKSIPASKITSGIISGQQIVLSGSSSIIRSLNYSSGNSGWKISGDGSVDFSRVGIGTASPTSELDVVGNISVSGTVDGRNISADGTKLDGIENNATADQTPQEILTAIKTVDGPNSGLDADTLDGNQAADFEPVGTTATHAADNDIHVVAGTATGQVATWNNSTGAWEAQTASGGVTDHGALTGLADDDHTQYPRFTASDVAPSSPRANDIWYHTNKGRIFVYYDSFWVENASAVITGTQLAALASGGTITDDGTYIYHTFTASGTFSLLSPGVLDVECIVVAGGGGGGSNNGGGGGAGGAIISSLSIQNTQNAIVGLGGAIDNNGSPSSFAGISVTGGGYGGSFSNKPGSDGGSGGGAGSSSSGVSPGGSGVLGQGYDGGSNYPSSSSGRSSGGGGGAGGLGEDGTYAKGGNGGPGVEWPSGSGVYYAAGGGGWVYSSNPSDVGLGGSSVGGNGGTYPSGVAATNPVANTGSGGGGGISSLPASAGADGVVIIRYNPSTDWVPSSILSLSPTLWLDASDASTIIESGGAVSQWSDKSGNDNHVTQNNASDKPTTGTNEINNLNVLEFYGSQILYRNTTAINNSVNRSWTIFGVVKPSATSGVRIAFGSDSGSRIGQFLRINNAVYETIGFSGGSAFTDSAGSAIIDEAVVLTSVNDSGNSLELFVNGASQASVNMGTQNYTSTIPLVVGDRNTTNSSGWSGSIAEIIAFDRKLTQQEREDIENILAQKWGITL